MNILFISQQKFLIESFIRFSNIIRVINFVPINRINKVQPNGSCILIDATQGDIKKYNKKFLSRFSQAIFVLVRHKNLNHSKRIIKAGAVGVFSLETPIQDILNFICISLNELRKESVKQTLSRKDLVVLKSIMKGASNKEIARKYGLTVSAVKYHARYLFKKLGVKNRTQAALLGRKIIV